MTSPELIAELRRVGARDPREIFLFMANHAHEVRLVDGQRLNDLTDFTAWLLELSAAAKGKLS